MKRRFRLVFAFVLLLAMALEISAKVSQSAHDASFRPVAVERLPDLGVPRSGHVLAYVNGELTVIGGHTTGFIPTATAEYYKNGRWHQLEILYPHDFGSWVKLASGELIIAGGSEQSFGRGQSWGVERYAPSTHNFESLPVLDIRRTRCGAARMADGSIILSGNWYEKDAISIYDPATGGRQVKEVSQGRTMPFILPVSADDAYIFSSIGNYGQLLDTVWVDRLQGDAFRSPVLEQWHPVLSDCGEMARYFIGDESIDGYAWLLLARNKADGRSGILKLVGEAFSLLETAAPIPETGMDGEPIVWGGPVADKASQTAWLISWSEVPSPNLYFLKVEYGNAMRGGKAPLTLYCARMPEAGTYSSITLVGSGRFAAVGGLAGDNYHPLATAFMLHTEADGSHGLPGWATACALLLLGGGLGLLLLGRRSRRKAETDRVSASDGPESGLAPTAPMEELMKRISDQMEEKQLFLKAGLTKEDVARTVGSNSRYISNCINALAGCSFIDYVNGYRIRYAQRLLYENPDMHLSEISEESGFSSEVTFYRNFKARTGQTPGEWLATQNRP